MPLHLNTLKLVNFRNCQKRRFEFSPKINMIFGGNAQGKTNLLEAVYLLATGRSFRTSQLSHLIQSGAAHFYLEAHFSKDGVEQTLKFAFDGMKKTIEHNTTPYTNFAPLLGLLPAVLIAPEDVQLINGPPLLRRRWLDLHIAQQDPLYIHHLVRYYRAMKQRNLLLKANSLEAISPWEDHMVRSGNYLIEKRGRIIASLALLLNSHLHILSNERDRIDLIYEPSQHELSLKLYEMGRERDLFAGATQRGPHRDDFTFSINETPAKTHASEGQKRSCLAALKLSEVDQIGGQLETTPLICIDDFGVHLDGKRKEILRDKLSEMGQVFVTSPNADVHFPKTTALFDIASDKQLCGLGGY